MNGVHFFAHTTRRVVAVSMAYTPSPLQVQECRAACQWSYAVSSLYSDELEQLDPKDDEISKIKIDSPKSKKKLKKIKSKQHSASSSAAAPLAKRPRTMDTEGVQRFAEQ